MNTRIGTLAAVILLGVGVLTGCSSRDARLSPTELTTPAAGGSMAPNLALGLDGNVYLSWVEPDAEGHALRFSSWDESGWTDPRTVARGTDWFVNWADFPSMAALADGTLAAHWLARSGPDPYAYDVRIALSRDGGATWSDPIVPHRDGVQAEHGFVSLVPTPSGEFEVVWLDGREMVAETPGAMTLRRTTLQRDGTLGPETLIDDRVCDCCSTDALLVAGGAMVVAYRDRTPDEIRDISVARRVGETWSAPRSAHEDHWVIAACPVNGPALAGSGDRIALSWFTSANDSPSVWTSFSSDGGRGFGEPIRVDQGRPLGRVDVVDLDDGSALVVWLEKTGERASILARTVGADGLSAAATVTATGESRSSGFPRAVRQGDRVFLAWTDDGEPSRVLTAVIAL